MKPYYDDGQCVIYHADCREVLASLPVCDLLLTDPPYGVGYVTARRLHRDPLVAPIANDESLDWLPGVLGGVRLGDNRHVYIFAAAHRVGDVIAALPNAWTFKNVLAWDKGEAGTVGDLEAGYGMNWEALIYANRGRRPLNGPRPRAILRFPWSGTRDPLHPTVKPVGLLRVLVERSSLPGELVLDPFMGSGTTLRAAKDLGRRAIGIEVEERYCEVAAQRLTQSSLALDFTA